MAEHVGPSETLVLARRSHVGCPKFSQPWSSVMKRVYITTETCVKFRQVKKANGFASDECALQYLLNCNEKRCLELSAIATDNHGAALPLPPASPLQLYTPVVCSTSRSTPPLNTRYDIRGC